MSDEAAGRATVRRAARTGSIPADALAFQGDRAGLVSRVAANSIDFALVVGFLVSCYVGLAAFLFLLNPTGFSFPPLRVGLAVIVGGVALGLYFWISWATSGRTYGDRVMGLRVVNIFGHRMRWAGAFLRAAFCVLLPVGLFWVLVSGANRSVQDVALRTSVIYDWGHDRLPH
jgi:uncharacterized RDD family membrane protein YckC